MKPKHDPTVTAEEQKKLDKLQEKMDELTALYYEKTGQRVRYEVSPQRGWIGESLAELASKDDDLIVASLAITVEDPSSEALTATAAAIYWAKDKMLKLIANAEPGTLSSSEKRTVATAAQMIALAKAPPSELPGYVVIEDEGEPN